MICLLRWFVYLQPVLHLRYDRVVGEEGKESSLPCEWHWDYETHEECHLKDQQEEDLSKELVSSIDEWKAVTVSSRTRL